MSETETERQPFSARWMIALWILLAVATALLAVILTTRTLLLTNMETATSNSVVQELDEFNTFLDQGTDPETAEPFRTTERLFSVYLSRQIPSDNEALLAIVGGQVMELKRTANADSTQPWETHTVREVLNSDAASGIFHTPDGERIHWGRIALQTNDGAGPEDYFVVAINTEPDAERIETDIRTIGLVGIGGLALISALAWLIAGQILGPMRQMQAVASQITETDLSLRVPVTGNDEIRAMAETFNDMLDRLEGVYAKQSQFIDDAGHELRTPITVIRGHLELLEQATPQQRARSVELTITELDRMARIVNELLTLAVADHNDFVRLEQVDLADLTIEIEDKARTLGNRNWIVSEISEDHARLDPQRVTQAMLELMNNARRHTGEGDTIEFGSRSTSDGCVELWVRDYGPGIAEDQLPLLFERFHRVAARATDSPLSDSTQPMGRPGTHSGAGLGLSIVKAIADAHGGQAWVESRLGQGSTFGLRLPLDDAVRRPVTDAETSGREDFS